jgi:hypothetical protein
VTGDEATLHVIGALNSSNIPYMLVGSLSSNYWGIPRSTLDADFVVDLGSHSLKALIEPLGPQFKLDPQMSFETVTGTKRNIIAVGGTEYKIELFRVSDAPYDRERFRRRKPATFVGQPTFVASAEDVIVTKLQWAHEAKRNKDIDDVQNVIAVQANHIDWDYVNQWCDRHGTRSLLDEIRASIPPI